MNIQVNPNSHLLLESSRLRREELLREAEVERMIAGVKRDAQSAHNPDRKRAHHALRPLQLDLLKR